MANLLEANAKKCLTVAGCLIHDGKVLLVKHKKVNLWLNPGGHVEADEAPHQAAEREFWEEAGIKVKAIDLSGLPPDLETDVLPNPISTNLHWVSKENYQARLKNGDNYIKEKKWKRGCEQHLNFLYLVKAVGPVKAKMNPDESTDLRWFTLKEVQESKELFRQIREELENAFRLMNTTSKR